MTVADPGVVECVDVAVTVIAEFGFGKVAGAVYRPFASIVPFALPPLTAQVTLWSVVLLTDALNCWV